MINCYHDILLCGGFMIEIKAMDSISFETLKGFGNNGFETKEIYILEENIEDQVIQYQLKVKVLDKAYKKHWETTEISLHGINKMVRSAISLGAYQEGELLGFILAQSVKWNNSLWIEDIRVKASEKGKGIAYDLLSALEILARKEAYRLIGLEVMATNFPAIKLYQKQGYRIDGFDRSHYPTRVKGQKETALFMKKYLSDLI